MKRYPSVHTAAPNKNVKVNYLFLDFNAFIYNTLHTMKEVFNNTNKFEDELVKLTIKNTLDLVNKTVKPDKLLYIAIDGPPPLAKMVQQRERRYKGPYVEKLLKEYKPDKVIEGINYDKNRITPGTRLMTKLNKEFEKTIKSGKFGKVPVVFSGSDIPGEAEHKYLKLIEEIQQTPNDVFVIFSGDGDAILLSFRFPDKKIYIMQGIANTALEEYYPAEQQYAYLNTSALGESIFDLYGNGRNKREFLVDFIFMTFIEGNDFAKPFFFLKYRDDRMRTPLGIYKFQRRLHNNNINLINYKDGQLYINQLFFKAIVKRLSVLEDDKIKEMQRRLEKKMSNKGNNNQELEHMLFSNQRHILHKDFVMQYDFLFKDFKKNYYEYFWGKIYNKDDICRNYLNILLFNIRYYFGTAIYWELNYNAVSAPLPSDLYDFLERNPNYLDNVKFEEKEPVEPFVLLAYVMPPKTMKDVLPKKYCEKLLKNYPEYFPENIELKLLVPGGKLIYAEPHLNAPSLDLLKKELKGIKLTKDEKLRNDLREEPIVYIPK